MKTKLMPSIVLGSICLVVALLLSVVNMFTAPIIAKNQSDKANEALAEVYPGGSGFQKLDITKYTLPESITAAYSEASGGFVIQSTVTGYKPGMIIMCGIDKDGKIVGADYVQSNETLSAEVGLGDRFVGKEQSELTPDIVAGSTAKLTTGAYYQAIVDSLNAFVILNGGSVDLRSPEDIKCNEALGTETLTFTKWFALESFEGIDTVYEANDNSARVYVIGESYIGVKNGEVVTADVSDENKNAVLAADTAIGAINLEDAAKPAGAKATVKSIKKASNGTYVFELEAKGYQAMFDWGDGTPISIKVSISADGKILDLVTVSHNETAGLGDGCATEEYYEQYRGKGDGDVKISSSYPTHDGTDLIPESSTDVGIIASATYTTVGYQTAIKDAFEAFNLLTSEEGGNQ